MTLTSPEDLIRGMTPQALAQGLVLAEIENSNLRQIVLWASQFVPKYRLDELKQKIREKTVENSAEEAAEKKIEFFSNLEELLTVFDSMVGTGRIPKDAGKYVILSNKLHEALPKQQQPTLASLRKK